MSAMASQITGVSIVYSAVCSGAGKKHQHSASLDFVRGTYRWPVNSPHKGPLTRKMFLCDDVIMIKVRYCLPSVRWIHWLRRSAFRFLMNIHHNDSANRWSTCINGLQICGVLHQGQLYHDDVIKCKYFLRYWPFVREIHRSPAISPHKGQWRGALMFSLILAGINGRVNNREAGGLRQNRAHYDVTVKRRRLRQDLDSKRALRRLVLSSTPLFIQKLIQHVNNKETIQAEHVLAICAGNHRSLVTNGQLWGKCVHVMTLSWFI